MLSWAARPGTETPLFLAFNIKIESSAVPSLWEMENEAGEKNNPSGPNLNTLTSTPLSFQKGKSAFQVIC